MEILNFLVQLAGAVMLLLYAVRMVRTGIERAFGGSFRRYVTTTSNVISAAFTGLLLAVVLQSSAAVALLVAGFVGTTALSFTSGLPIILGADLGSSLLIQILSFDLDWLLPGLLAVGGGLFTKSDRRSFKQAGRIILGIAFILISLRFLRETMIPIRDGAFLPTIAAYLEGDFLTAFIAGTALAFIMHSSVATILMCVTFVAIDAIPLNAGIALVLGANLGSALIPVWLSRGMNAPARRVTMANLLIRGTGAAIALFVLTRFSLPPWILTMGDAQALINVHVLFNLCLLLTLPLCRLIEHPVRVLLPDVLVVETENPILRPALNDAALDRPNLAIASLRREVLRVAQIIECMLIPAMPLFTEFDKSRMNAIREQGVIVNAALIDIKRYVAKMPETTMDSDDVEQVRELIDFAIALETAGDIVGKRLLTLAQEKSEEGVRLSRAGGEELHAMHERTVSCMTLSMNLLVSSDLETARLMLEEKSELLRLERSSRKKHLKRLRDGSAVSFDSSNIHLETLRALNEFNSRIASLAYSILYRGGQLLETRLIESLDGKNRP